MSQKMRRSQRQTLDLEQLKQDPNSFLTLNPDDEALRKLEMIRLYKAGYAPEDIMTAFGYSGRTYFYELFNRFQEGGTEALIDRRGGSEPRKRTQELEAQVIRAKALDPQLGDSELGRRFGLDRSTVYELLKEHDIQDLHRVITAQPSSPDTEDTAEPSGEKGGANHPLSAWIEPDLGAHPRVDWLLSRFLYAESDCRGVRIQRSGPPIMFILGSGLGCEASLPSQRSSR